MSWYYESCVLAYVAGGLLCSLLYDEGAEATEIHILAMSEAVLYYGHELFHYGEDRSLIDAGCLSDFVYYFCFSHINISSYD